MEKRIFFLLKVKTKIKARWIEHIIKTQIGVNLAIVDFDKRLILVEYHTRLITIQYMRMLVRSLGCDMIFDEKEIQIRQNQLGNFFVLKKRKTILSSVFFISFLGLICPFSDWLLFLLSIMMLFLYLSLFIPLFNRHFIRLIGFINGTGLLFSLFFLLIGIIKMFYYNTHKGVFLYFFIAIIILQLVSFYRWIKEKSAAEKDLL